MRMTMMRLSSTALTLAASAALIFGAGCMADYYDEDISGSYQHIVNGTINQGDPALGLVFLGAGTCSGTMVTNKVMTTARHCVIDRNGVDRKSVV